MKMKKSSILFVGLLTVALTSCGGNNNSGTSTDSTSISQGTTTTTGGVDNTFIVNEAVKQVTILNNYDEVREQLQCLGQVTILDDNEDEFIVPITWTADNSSKWTFTEKDESNLIYATPVFPVEGEEQAYNYTLTATAAYGGATATKNFSGKVMPKAQGEDNILTTAEARETAADTKITVKGIVWKAAKVEANGFYVCDTTGCIYVYDQGKNAVTEGNEVKVTGYRTDYIGSFSGTHQIAGNTAEPLEIETVSTTKKALPLEGAVAKTASQMTTSALKNTDRTVYGQLFKTTGKLEIYTNPTWGTPTYEVVDSTGYVAFYPASVEANTIYAWLKAFMNEDGSSNGKTYDVYYVIYDFTLDAGVFGKNRMLPYFVQEVA